MIGNNMTTDRPVFCRSSRALIEKCNCYRCVDVKKPLIMQRLSGVGAGYSVLKTAPRRVL